ASTAGKDRVAQQIAVYIKVVEGRRETAREGIERALAALREATGLGPDARIAVADAKLPDVAPQVSRDDVIALALARRGEMALSARADAMAEKTRGLIALEADDAFHKWQETARRLPRARDAAESARALSDKLAKDAKDPNLDVRFSEAMGAGALASQLKLEAN